MQILNKEEYIVEDTSTRINLNELNSDELSSLRFFFGGFGDARHIYASLIDLHSQAVLLPTEKQQLAKVSFVVNDIKPHPMAKLMVIFSVLRKLSAYDYAQIGSDYEATKWAALSMYLFACNVMPAYLAKELALIIEDLTKTELLDEQWSFLRINASSWSQVKEVLQQWSTKSPLSTQKMMKLWTSNSFDKMSPLISPDLGLGSAPNTTFGSHTDEMRDKLIQSLEKMTEDSRLFDDIKSKNAADKASIIKKRKEAMINTFKNMSIAEMMELQAESLKMADNYYLKNSEADNRFANQHKYLLPPVAIRDEKERSLLTQEDSEVVKS